jgi:integrase
MSSVRKRTLPSGEIRWQVDYKDQGGKRRAKQFATKAEAVAHETKIRGELQAGIHVADAASVTVAKAGDLWVAAGARDGLEETTVRQRRQHVDLHIKPLIGSIRLSRLTVAAAKEFRDKLVETRSRAMARRVLTSFKGIIAEARLSGLMGHNPAEELKVTKRRAEEAGEADAVVIPPKEHLRAMLAKSAELWPLTRVERTREGEEKVVAVCWRPLIVTDIFTGMRASELRGLAWPHIDFQAGIIRVRQRADRFNKLGPPKSKAGRRDIPMAPIVVNTLKEWKLACPKTDADLVFPSERGEILWHTNLYQQCFVALLEACGLLIPPAQEGDNPSLPFNFHALRHAAASLFIEQGWTPKKVQVVMGHSSIQVTFDIYGHLFPTPEDDAKAMAQIEARLIGSSG